MKDSTGLQRPRHASDRRECREQQVESPAADISETGRFQLSAKLLPRGVMHVPLDTGDHHVVDGLDEGRALAVPHHEGTPHCRTIALCLRVGDVAHGRYVIETDDRRVQACSTYLQPERPGLGTAHSGILT